MFVAYIVCKQCFYMKQKYNILNEKKQCSTKCKRNSDRHERIQIFLICVSSHIIYEYIISYITTMTTTTTVLQQQKLNIDFSFSFRQFNLQSQWIMTYWENRFSFILHVLYVLTGSPNRPTHAGTRRSY